MTTVTSFENEDQVSIGSRIFGVIFLLVVTLTFIFLFIGSLQFILYPWIKAILFKTFGKATQSTIIKSKQFPNRRRTLDNGETQITQVRKVTYSYKTPAHKVGGQQRRMVKEFGVLIEAEECCYAKECCYAEGHKEEILYLSFKPTLFVLKTKLLSPAEEEYVSFKDSWFYVAIRFPAQMALGFGMLTLVFASIVKTFYALIKNTTTEEDNNDFFFRQCLPITAHVVASIILLYCICILCGCQRNYTETPATIIPNPKPPKENNNDLEQPLL